MSLLSVESLRVRLPTPAGLVTVVDGVDYEVEPGQVFGVAGESGSGKTMSVLALLGLLPPGVGSLMRRPSTESRLTPASPRPTPSAGRRRRGGCRRGS